MSLSGVTVAPAGLKAGIDCAGVATEGLAGWAGRNQAARMAPAAATPPATRQPIDSPCRNALLAAVWMAWPRAPCPAALTWSAAAYAAPSDWCAMAETPCGSPAGRLAVSREPYSDA